MLFSFTRTHSNFRSVRPSLSLERAPSVCCLDPPDQGSRAASAGAAASNSFTPHTSYLTPHSPFHRHLTPSSLLPHSFLTPDFTSLSYHLSHLGCFFPPLPLLISVLRASARKSKYRSLFCSLLFVRLGPAQPTFLPTYLSFACLIFSQSAQLCRAFTSPILSPRPPLSHSSLHNPHRNGRQQRFLRALLLHAAVHGWHVWPAWL